MIPTLETRLDHVANVLDITVDRLQKNDAELAALQNSIDNSVLNLLRVRADLVSQLEEAMLKHNELSLLQGIKLGTLGVFDVESGEPVSVTFVDASSPAKMA